MAHCDTRTLPDRTGRCTAARPTVTSEAMRFLLLVLSLAIAAPAAAAKKAVVMPLVAGEGVSRGVADAVTEAVVVALQRGGVQTVTRKDLETAMALEEQRAKVNVEIARKLDQDVCVEDSACLTEIGGALGAELMVSGSVARIGESALLTVQLFDTRRAVVLKRHQERRKGADDAFLDAVEPAVSALLGTEAPEKKEAQGAASTCSAEGVAVCIARCEDADAASCTAAGVLTDDGRNARPAREAAAWFRRGCDGGDPAGCVRLGALRETGRGVDHEKKDAAGLYARACRLGLQEGCDRLAELNRPKGKRERLRSLTDRASNKLDRVLHP